MLYHSYDPSARYYKYMCTNCRITRKLMSICPTCRKDTTCIGPKFRPPKYSNKKEWLKLKNKYYDGSRVPGHWFYF